MNPSMFFEIKKEEFGFFKILFVYYMCCFITRSRAMHRSRKQIHASSRII